MTTTIKIKNIINTPINYNYNFEDIDINELTNNLLDKINNIIKPNENNINVEELGLFYEIFIGIIKDDDEIIEFILKYITEKFKKKNKFLYKFDTDKLFDKYLTNKIKYYDLNIFNKYCGNNKLINHNEILYYLYNYLPDDIFEIDILIPAFSLFKHQITNTNILNKIFEIVK
jgi:hypothetical protein